MAEAARPTVDPSPPSDRLEEPVQVQVYKFTGPQGLFTIPESWCRECDMFARTADRAAEAADVDVEVEILSWWRRMPSALRHGGWHPPVFVVDGERIAQGHDVPSVDRVLDAIEAAADRRSRERGEAP